MARLIIHAPTRAALTRARRNLANLLAADPAAKVELVVNGEAAKAEIEDPDPTTRPYLVLCRNSLNAAGLTPPDDARVTQAAVLYIAERQAEGWAYFRA
jgi:intracellular sulfur oxidation DsrE/DsrF family protein